MSRLNLYRRSLIIAAAAVVVAAIMVAFCAAALMPAAFAQGTAGVLPQLAPGQSLGLALGMPTVPNLRDAGQQELRERFLSK